MSHATSDAVFCIYCEDIRHEVDGKMSVIGWLGPRMAMPANGLPLTLPKLCAVINIRRTGLEPMQSLRITLRHNDTVLQSISPTSDHLAAMQADILKDAREFQLRGISIKLNLQMQFFSIQTPGKLSTFVEIDGQPEIEAEGLRFVQ